MEIILNNAEFEEAIKCYLSAKGFSTDTYDVKVRVVQGRSGSGNRAEVELTEKGKSDVVQEPTAVVKDILQQDLLEEKETAKSESPFGKPAFGSPFGDK